MMASCPSCGTKNKILHFNVPIETKKKLFKRANNKCEECGKKVQLEIHHIKPKQQGINNSLKNLKFLCHECHLKKGISNRTQENRKLCVINETFTDEEYEKLKREKGKISWHDFILKLVKIKKENKK